MQSIGPRFGGTGHAHPALVTGTRRWWRRGWLYCVRRTEVMPVSPHFRVLEDRAGLESEEDLRAQVRGPSVSPGTGTPLSRRLLGLSV